MPTEQQRPERQPEKEIALRKAFTKSGVDPTTASINDTTAEKRLQIQASVGAPLPPPSRKRTTTAPSESGKVTVTLPVITPAPSSVAPVLKPPPLPTKKTPATTEALTASNVRNRFENFDLLQLLGQHSFQSVRDHLAGYNYLDLMAQEERYNRAVRDLTRNRTSRMAPRKLDLTDGQALENYLFESVNDRSLIGKLNPKHTGPTATAHGGFSLHYGNLETDVPLTTFWINPHIEDVPETIKILDTCLAGCNAQIKLHAASFIGEPGAATADKIVVYLKTDDKDSINTFTKNLHRNFDYLTPHLQPERFRDVIRSFRIPLIPGITFVERNNEYSWDTNYGNMMQNAHFTGRDTMIERWAKTDKQPDPQLFRIFSQINDPSRNKRMPGLGK